MQHGNTQRSLLLASTLLLKQEVKFPPEREDTGCLEKREKGVKWSGITQEGIDLDMPKGGLAALRAL